MAVSEKTKMVLNNCKYYEEIVDYPFNEGDLLAKYVIEEYSHKIFDVDSQDFGKVNYLKVLDLSVYEFLRDNNFSSKVKERLTFENINYSDNEKLIEIEILDIIVEEYKKFRNRSLEKHEDTIWL